jgi:pyrimidine operon attenuation protein/uracil phosphoribosyltransferase
MGRPQVIVSGPEIKAMLLRLADEIIARHGDCSHLALVGIQRRGADLAVRLKTILDERLGRKLPLGKLDINLYRDDWTSLSVQPQIQCTEIPFDLAEHQVVLVDDVLFTGRTTRAALEAILDYGRARRVELLALVDRGNRELPIQPDYAGLRLETSPEDHVNVYLSERDAADEVVVDRAG